jgi:UDP-N-acetylglucosamine 2-epimerase (non-hydrolysing)
MVVYGTRPEAIKMAPVVQKMRDSPALSPIVVVTGQHRSMLDQVNDLFGIRPDHDLDIISPRQSLDDVTTKVIKRMSPLLSDYQPAAVLVQGDTTTTFATALAASYQRVPVAHLEAGLRTNDIRSPFPEELNRQMTTRMASLHLAPTVSSAENLTRENVDRRKIIITGNTVIDALLSVAHGSRPFDCPALNPLRTDPRRLLLVTAHRRESWGIPMARIASAVATLAHRHPEIVIALPVHQNPVVRDVLLPPLVGLSNVSIVEPLPYGDFARLMARADLILTDSGGIQEEGPSLGKPVLVMRDKTERPEAVRAGTVKLVGTHDEQIIKEVELLLEDDATYQSMARAVNPYGDGRAAGRVVQALLHLCGLGAPAPEFQPPRGDLLTG